LLVTPGSDQVYATVQRDGYLDTLKEFGATILANACGPCIGQWKREDVKAEDEASGKPNVIVTSFNRNFRGRNDSFKSTLAFIGSPEVVVAKTLAGSLSFNPVADTVKDANGHEVKLEAPEGEPLRLEFESFVAAIRGEGPVLVTGEEGRRALSVALKIVEEIERTAPAFAGELSASRG